MTMRKVCRGRSCIHVSPEVEIEELEDETKYRFGVDYVE
jgi:hypothetical protein